MTTTGVNHPPASAAARTAEDMAETMATLPGELSEALGILYYSAYEVEVPLVDFEVEARDLISIAAENAENLAKNTRGSADEIVQNHEEAADRYSATPLPEGINFF